MIQPWASQGRVYCSTQESWGPAACQWASALQGGKGERLGQLDRRGVCMPRGAETPGGQWERLSSPPGQVRVEELVGSSRCLWPQPPGSCRAAPLC